MHPDRQRRRTQGVCAEKLGDARGRAAARSPQLARGHPPPALLLSEPGIRCRRRPRRQGAPVAEAHGLPRPRPPFIHSIFLARTTTPLSPHAARRTPNNAQLAVWCGSRAAQRRRTCSRATHRRVAMLLGFAPPWVPNAFSSSSFGGRSRRTVHPSHS